VHLLVYCIYIYIYGWNNIYIYGVLKPLFTEVIRDFIFGNNAAIIIAETHTSPF
jgi:hypothetical protein